MLIWLNVQNSKINIIVEHFSLVLKMCFFFFSFSGLWIKELVFCSLSTIAGYRTVVLSSSLNRKISVCTILGWGFEVLSFEYFWRFWRSTSSFGSDQKLLTQEVVVQVIIWFEQNMDSKYHSCVMSLKWSHSDFGTFSNTNSDGTPCSSLNFILRRV